MNTDILVAINNVLSSYIPEKDRPEAAASVIAEIAELPISERDLKAFASTDKYLKVALQEYLCEDEDEDDYGDYEIDDDDE